MASPPDAEKDRAARLPNETLLRWLRDMLLIREFEVRSMQAYQNKKIGGFLHIYIGQEAVAVGTIAALNDNDPVITAYRDHGHPLARGTDPRYLMAELYGRIGGCAKGKGGSMHFFDRSRHFYGGHGIVGAQCPVGAGLAFATRYEDEVVNGGRSGRVTMCFLGDGALNQGAFHEAMNLAGVLGLPIIFAVENNGYAMGTSVARGTTVAGELTAKAGAYGMDSVCIEGMDVMNLYDALKPVVDDVRERVRPWFVELRTYRFKGHSMSDPRKYRSKEEEQQYETEDPIDRLGNFLMTERNLTKTDYDKMVKAVREQVRRAVKWAENSPVPGPEELYTDVYADEWGPYTGTTLPSMLGDNPEGESP